MVLPTHIHIPLYHILQQVHIDQVRLLSVEILFDISEVSSVQDVRFALSFTSLFHRPFPPLSVRGKVWWDNIIQNPVIPSYFIILNYLDNQYCTMSLRYTCHHLKGSLSQRVTITWQLWWLTSICYNFIIDLSIELLSTLDEICITE